MSLWSMRTALMQQRLSLKIDGVQKFGPLRGTNGWNH
jgi:hypothetical protein